MRHRKHKKLPRKHNQSKALLKSLANALFLHGKIETTLSRAKLLRPFIEKIITRAIYLNLSGDPIDRVHHARIIRKYINTKDAYLALVDVWGKVFIDRPGGYTRIIKTNRRKGDGAELAFIELIIDIDPTLLTQKRFPNNANLRRKLYQSQKLELYNSLKRSNGRRKRRIKEISRLPRPKFTLQQKATTTQTQQIEVALESASIELHINNKGFRSNMYPLIFSASLDLLQEFKVTKVNLSENCGITNANNYTIRLAPPFIQTFCFSLTIQSITNQKMNPESNIGSISFFKENGTFLQKLNINRSS